MYSGVSETVKQTLKEEGWVGLTRGMCPRVLHSVCFAALGYFAFETVQDEAKNKIALAMYSGVSETVKQILKEEGWVGLTRGMGPRVLHSVCFAALGYFAFETARLSLLHRYLQRKEMDLDSS
ncbi:hypothetical protein NE237_027443 [Protea cynaroides]|uniref:Uncharacterized protein n=1 Tax=Protea cynaroides TaxID=273540 RepID=A0A9Q0JT02_9MAGN|nr:hypothetical protein NE237_027443 [Protea cynaroides]